MSPLVAQDAPPSTRVDHVGLGLGSLEAAVDLVRERTGIEPEYGGEHPHLGTHNALLSLGPGRYLEVIAARPETESSAGMAGYLRGLEELTGVLWAVAVDDVEATRRGLEEAGFATSEPQPGSRITPAGATLEWTTFGIANPQIPAVPFFIRWTDGTPHPSTTSPEGCALTGLAVTTPAADDLRRLVDALDLTDVEIHEGPPSISPRLECPRGRVSF